MSLQNFSYFFFFIMTACVYLHLPKKTQTPFLLLASIVFYGKNLSVSYQAALTKHGASSALFCALLSISAVIFLALFVWRMGLRLTAVQDIIANTQLAYDNMNNDPATMHTLQQSLKQKTQQKTALLRRSVFVLVALLCVFKYYNFSPLPSLFDGSVLARLPFPLGISFFTFAAIAYLVDVARGTCKAEQSLVHLSTFLFFFATVTSGPICRGGQLLPQLHAEHRLDASADRTVNGLRLFAIGLFKKIAVADLLLLLVDQVYNNASNYGAPLLLFATLCCTLQLYFDFSGYTDLARASAMLLGIDLPENFRTPFVATNFSMFWARWHITLSQWFRDYLYISLGGNRKGSARKYVNLCIVFLCTGFWHGNNLPFMVWGILLAAYRLGEEVCHRIWGTPDNDNASAALLWGKRAAVFSMWGFGMIFFRIGSGNSTNAMAACGEFLAGLTQGWANGQFFAQLNSAIAAGFYQNQMLQIAYLLFAALTLSLAFYLDAQRFFFYADAPNEAVLAAHKPVARWAIYYLLVLCIFAGLIIQNGGFGGASFAYAQY